MFQVFFSKRPYHDREATELKEGQDRLKHGEDDTAKSMSLDGDYTNDEGMLDDHSARWQPRRITKALLRSAGDSLESLELTAKCFKGVEFRNNEPFIWQPPPVSRFAKGCH